MFLHVSGAKCWTRSFSLTQIERIECKEDIDLIRRRYNEIHLQLKEWHYSKLEYHYVDLPNCASRYTGMHAP
jgi:hypothetical protein